jgi:hypothetical protein
MHTLTPFDPNRSSTNPCLHRLELMPVQIRNLPTFPHHDPLISLLAAILGCSGDPATNGVLRGLSRRATGEPPAIVFVYAPP